MTSKFQTSIGVRSRSGLARLAILLILAVILGLIGFRLILPGLVKDYVNRQINSNPGYTGNVEEIELKLWRGAYTIHGILIEKVGGDPNHPFFRAPTINLSVQWRALLQLALVAEIEMDSPEITFIQGDSIADSQIGVDQPWLPVINDLFPLKVNYFKVRDGTIRYVKYSGEHHVEFDLDDVQIVGENLTNSLKLSDSLVGTIRFDCAVSDDTRLTSDIQFDPSSEKPTFSMSTKMDGMDVTQLNGLTEAFAGFHFTKGTLSVTSELEADNGELNGYIEPMLDHFSIIDPEDIRSPLKFAWEVVVAGVGRLFRNQPNDRFATKIPISGTLDHPEMAVLPTLGNILRNAFIKVYTGDFEGIPNE